MQRDAFPCGLFSFVSHPCALMQNIQSFWFSEKLQTQCSVFPKVPPLGFWFSAHTCMNEVPAWFHCENKWLQREYLNMVIWEVPRLFPFFFVMTSEKLPGVTRRYLCVSYPSGHEPPCISVTLNHQISSSVRSVRRLVFTKHKLKFRLISSC